ncbi:hypothetical protein B7G68_00595 [Caulobacter segnis]|uniref:Uncharacterized protein n=3 Tax=Caulobacter segnis TaxID=88688 RepID=D5VDU2_CAUST|nr:hypothetical protein [Caulobacter segnis]ADG08642.1 hypothetical protein Cseg_0115 [Caulobacter segnis ATCC 21756]AVQ00495.1 hypothetical protein B7G68_00595 [Caulobacter segnis]
MDLHDNLRAEYVLIQGQYEAFDQRALSLKALATPLLGTGLAFGVKEHSVLIVLATAMIAICLWALEAIWKGFQYAYIDRISLLEAWFRGEVADLKPFQVFQAWSAAYRTRYGRLGATVRLMGAPFVALPYAVIVLGALLTIGYLTGGRG